MTKDALTCDTLSVVLFLITLHTHFVTANDGLQAVLFAEALGDIWSELHSNTTLARATARLGLRVCPQHFHHEAGLARLSLVVAVQLSNIIQSDIIIGEETSVKHEVLLADQSSQRQCRKAFREELEDALIVLGLAFTLETVNPVHVVRLVVAAIQEESIWPQPLVGIQQQSDLA